MSEVTKTSHDTSTDEGRKARIEELKTESAQSAFQIGLMMTRKAITQGAISDLASLTYFVNGVVSTAAMHIAIEQSVETNAPELMLPIQADTMRDWGKLLISIADGITLANQPPATATPQ